MFHVSAQSIRIAIRQIKRWSFASIQDKNPGIALLHANYAVGDLSMLREMVNDNKIKKATGIDPFKLHLQTINLQDKAQTKLLKKCPNLKIPGN